MRCLFGVDAVDLDRIEGLMLRHGERFLERVAGPREQSWFLAEPSARTAGLFFATKEAVIKAVGGRPPGFGWRSAGPMQAAPEVPEEPEAVLTSLVVGAGLTEALSVGLRLDGALRKAAERALTERLLTGQTFAGTAPRVHGAVRYGQRDGHLLAVVVLWAQPPAPPL